MKNLLNTLRNLIDIEEVFYFFGMGLLYTGSALQFGHPIALIVIGGILILTAFYLARFT